MQSQNLEYNMVNAAVELDDVEGARALIAKFPGHINLPLQDERTPLHTAVIKNNPEMVQMLLDNKANVNPVARSKVARPPLWLAMVLNHPELAVMLIRSGANVNEPFGFRLTRDQYDYDELTTCLHLAVYRRDAFLARLLIYHGADLSAKNSRNRTPLYDALRYGCPVDLIEEMLDLGARSELIRIDSKKRSYLHPVICVGNEAVLRLLLKQPQIDATKPYLSSKTVLHLAAEAVVENSNIATILLDAGVNINAVETTNGNSALHTALRNGKVTVAKVLIERGANLNTRNREGFYPLHYAAQRINTIEMIDLLLNNGADPQVQMPTGLTALHIAVKNGFVDKIKSLLIYGADPFIKDLVGRTAFDMVKPEMPATFQLLIERLAMAQVAEKKVIPDEILQLIDTWQMQDYFDVCSTELASMRPTKVYNEVSLLYVLGMTDEKLSMLMRNEAFLPSFISKYSEGKFPIYKDYIPQKLRRADEKMRSYSAVEDHLRKLFIGVIPDVALRLVAAYLKTDDLIDCDE